MYCTICNPHSPWPDWISATEHIKRDHVEGKVNLTRKVKHVEGQEDGPGVLPQEPEVGETLGRPRVGRELVTRS